MDNFNKKIIGASIVVVIILAAGIFWWQYRGTSRGGLEVGDIEIETGLDLDFLDTQRVERRTRYGSFPIETPEEGRDNPFEPY